MSISIRRANSSDCGEIARILWRSESEDHALYSYAQLFGLDEESFLKAFSSLINNEFDGHGLGYRSYWMIESEGRVVGGFSIYYEKSENSSSLLASGALMQYFSRLDLSNAFKKLAPYRPLQIEKTVGTYQLDTVAIFDQFAGKGIFGEAFRQVSSILKMEPDLSITMEVQIWNQNASARRAYEKVGFALSKEGERNEMGKGRDVLTCII